jgi:EAL domain-containing protein (putative c-di-GMP-specific phosphodiesterase class I)/DNA-binding NarL/FixJ family response regulator
MGTRREALPRQADDAAPSPTGGTVRVLLADDEPGVRGALAELVQAEPSLALVGVAGDADEAAALAERRIVDVAVVDVRMPGGGHRAVREIRNRSPHTKVVAFSAYGDHSAVVGMVASGAVSYLVKGAPGRQVVEAIHRAAHGESILSDEAAGPLIGELTDQLQRRERELIDRERKVGRIQAALRPGGLEVAFQPVFDLANGRRRGVEALARFNVEPQRTPDAWFREAWEVGLGLDLELAAVAAALPALDTLAADEFLAVNVSPAVLESPRFQQLLPAGSHLRLLVEVTEHAQVEDYDRLGACLEELRRAGVRLGIDDAGAGYASLRHILWLAPDVVKLDMSLTRDLQADTRRRALVAALVPFAAEIGATVIAEGIETEDELAALRAFGAAWGQGFLLGRPGPLLQGHRRPGSQPSASPQGGRS